jgi:biopolymer transport protein ExbB
MKKLFALIAVTGMLFMLASNVVYAQEPEAEQAAPETEAAPVTDLGSSTAEPAAEPEMTLHKQVKRLFIEGGATFMGFVLLTLIFGLALAIERIIYLNLATTNTDKLLKKIEDALSSGGVDAAKEVCRWQVSSTRDLTGQMRE